MMTDQPDDDVDWDAGPDDQRDPEAGDLEERLASLPHYLDVGPETGEYLPGPGDVVEEADGDAPRHAGDDQE